MFQYEFMRNAFLVGTALSIVSALVGYYVIVRHQAFAGEALSDMAFTGATKRYWRIDYNSSSLAVKPQIGEIFLGSKFSVTYRHKYGGTFGTKYANIQQETWDGGQSAYNQYASKKRTWRLTFPILGTTLKASFDDWFDSVRGSLRPFMMSLDAGVTWALVRVTEDQINYAENSANYWETSLTFIEQLD